MHAEGLNISAKGMQAEASEKVGQVYVLRIGRSEAACSIGYLDAVLTSRDQSSTNGTLVACILVPTRT